MKQTVDWHQHWTRKSPGFHEGRVNAYLQQYLPLFDLDAGSRIFMPLCGKAVDILWLSQQGFEVVGVELSGVAIRDFFEESELDYSVSEDESFKIYSAHRITLYEGDFMNLTPSHLQDCQLVYDRASIVAIEEFNRASYVNKMFSLVAKTVPMLMVTLEYDQQVMNGPPFSVEVDEIRGLYSPRYETELLCVHEQIDERPRWRERGLQSLKESTLRLIPKSR